MIIWELAIEATFEAVGICSTVYFLTKEIRTIKKECKCND